MKHLKWILVLAMTSTSAFAAEGVMTATASPTRQNTLDLKIHGDAAVEISRHLTVNQVAFHRDPFSGALVQYADGIRCIDQHGGESLYCYIAISGDEVVQTSKVSRQ